jgi:hypothetical protein
MTEPAKITIIEGPPPTFELVGDPWLLGLIEGPLPSRVAVCRVRTANGPALVERCYRAWRDGQPIYLEYRSEDGLTEQAPITAVRFIESDDSHLLLLWVRLEEVDSEIEFEFDDEMEDDFDFDIDYEEEDDEDQDFDFSI